MNKSKFLKKSLAALLAVMLVVAMVPLSAAADEMPEFPLPNMTRLYINGSDVALEDGVFAANISSTATSVNLRADNGSLGPAGSPTVDLVVVKPGSVTTTPLTTSNVPVIFATDATEADGVVTIKLRMTHKGNQNSFKDFEVKLTRTTQGTTAELESATPIQSTGLYTAEIGDNVINVTVAREAGSTAGSTNPSITLKAKDNATIAGTVSGRPLTAGNTVRVDKVADGETITITSESQNNTAEWTFKVTYVDALDTISVNGVTGVISDKLDNSNFTTTTPDGIPDTVTVSLEASAFEDTLGNIQLTKKLPVSFSVKGNITTVNINAATDINAATNATEVKAGGTFTFDKVDSTNPSQTYNLWVPSGNDGTNKDWQQYKLVIELKRDNSTAIESAVIMDEIATIDGAKIHAVLPEQTATGATISLGAINDIKLVTDSSVTSVYMDDTTTPPVNFFKKTANTPVAGKTTWESNSKAADLSSPKIITVTAENGEIQQYTISAEKDTNRTLAELNSITLQDPAGNRYDGVISGHKVTFNNIPYMTTSLLDWKVFAEPNASATALISNGTPAQNVTIVNGTTTGEKLFADATLAVAPNKTRTYTGVNVKVVNKNDQSVFTEYTTELVLVAPKTGNTLSSLKVSAQTTTPVNAINNVVNDRITDANTITGEIKKKYTDNTGTITFKQPFSLSRNNSQSSGVYDVITELTTDNGGVAYMGVVNAGVLSLSSSNIYSVGKMSALSNDKDTFGSSYMIVQNSSGFASNLAIVVLPEEIARTVASNATSIIKADTDLGTIYSVKDEALDAEHNANLKSIAIGDTTLTISGDKITGTLPYSLTTDKTDGTNAKFVTFETQSKFAYWTNFNSEGKVAGVEQAVGSGNLKLVFKQAADHKVEVYTYDGTTAAPMTNNEFTVNAEDCLVGGVGATHSTHKYTFDLKWADPNTEAKITSFSVAGRTGAISGQNVTVAVPYLTDVKGLIPTFTLSSGATMMLDDASKGVIESGKTTLDFSNPVKVIVKSEDGKRTEHYTITVNEGEMFTDVNTNDWFYDVVLKAATEGWINGRGDGIFDPYSTMTRADFANIIAKMQGFNPDDYTDSRFADVPSSHYASAAIAFCADKEYINGVGDNNFDPGANITREQAAAIICRVNGIKEEAGNTTYADDANISTWAKGYVKAATTSGIFEGEGEGFNPQRPLRRCEGAAILVRSTSK